jgi:DNA polymerase I-like protein with 3'-5' exonuclease and polymerase domains
MVATVGHAADGGRVMQFPLFTPETSWTAPKLSELPSWEGAKRVCVDLETRDPQLKKLGVGVRRDGYIVGVGFAIEDGPAFYLPTRHEGGGNLRETKVFEYLKDQALSFRGDIVGANLQYDLDYLAEQGIIYREAIMRDVQIAEPLIDENQYTYSLDAIAKRYGIPGKDETLLRQAAQTFHVDPKAGLWQLPAKFVGPYGEQDVRLPLQLLRRQEKIIDDQNLWEAYNMECRLLPVLLKMRRRGVAVDFDKLDEVEQWALREERTALSEVSSLTGIQLSESDTTKASALAPCLQKVGIVVPRTPKNDQPSVKNDFLKSIDHPVGKLLVRAKKFNKIRRTFVSSIRRYAVKGRIHCTFNQLRRSKDDGTDDEQGGRYGRMSCTDPNLQQQPSKKDKDNIGPIWRSIYVPDGGAWCCADYSQQEPRWLTHFAALCGCSGAESARNEYRNNPKMDNHQFMAELTGIDRDNAKEIFLGRCYGMGGAKFCYKVGLPTITKPNWRTGEMYEAAGPEGQRLLDIFDVKAPYVREISRIAQSKAERVGYIKLIDGRRCRFPTAPGGTYDWTYKALNRLIQGSSAVQMKIAMLAADEAGFKIQLQVHDELDLSIRSREEARELEAVMLEAVPCTVPHRVDIEIGPSWGEIKDIDKSKILG